MTVRANQLAGLSAAIERVSRLDVPADTLLSAFFRANAAMGQRDRAFVAEGAYAYLRRKRSLDALAATADPHKLALSVLVRELGFSVRDLEPVLAKDDAAWLADFKFRARSALPPAPAQKSTTISLRRGATNRPIS